jgi:uncharacterized membrane protein YkvA (DUF1232 family)
MTSTTGTATASASADASREHATRERGHSRRRGGSSVSRFLGLLALLPLAGRAPLYARLLWALVLDDRVPASRKALLVGALGYVVLARDIVPDSIPLVGGLDDLVVVAVAVDLFLDGVDTDVLAEKLAMLEIPRLAFEDDLNQIRRLLPGPIRRTVRRLPEAMHVVGHAIQQAGLGPRLRSWFESEGSPA